MLAMQFPAIDPVLIDLPGPLDVRFYGLMYVVGFVVGQIVLTRLSRARFLPIPEERVGDLIFYLVIGVILGGRLGYALFYDSSLLGPIRIFQVWKGGLAFHGGLIGVVAALWWFARKLEVARRDLPVLGWRVGDGCALAVTPGIFCVRIANFLNGELYGRETGRETFGAMQFPTDPAAREYLGLHSFGDENRAVELAIRCAFGKVDLARIRERADVGALFGPDAPPALSHAVLRDRFPEIPLPEGSEILSWPAMLQRFPSLQAYRDQVTWDKVLDWEAVRPFVPYRYASQLYEACGEGLLVGALLWVVYLLTRRRPLGPGGFSGVFLIGYGAVRFFIEFLRKPDAQFITAENPTGAVFLGMTMGQSLCTAMVLAGALLVGWAARRRGRLPGPVAGAEVAA